MTRPGPSPDLDEDTDLSEPARHEMVSEAAAIFGEEAARELANRLRVPFEPYTAEPQI
ncbi:hypothetical protein [Methylobacterium sp. J-067]|uniref:hypothetical protein n=1 Tax=Methylobacterium sp. J-067 TaxID=2836648 RepID=UPI001FB96311|nr:hypothetical protein [Methylobacterium sp. J-067]MCJ2023939.1 hypothetical protein [Methylobacterium sp. J-067]